MGELRYIEAMEYYSTLKINELSSHKETWKKLKCISLSERNQSKMATILYNFNYMTFWRRQN